VQSSVPEYSGGGAISLQDLGGVRDDDDGRATETFVQDITGFLVEGGISGAGHAFVDQVDVKIEGEEECEGKSRLHTGGISRQRHFEIFFNINKVSAERLHVIRVHPIETGDIAAILSGGVFALNAAHETKREGDARGALDFAFVRLLQTGHHIDNSGFSGSVGGQNAHGLANIDREVSLIEDDFSGLSGPKGLTDVSKFDHFPETFPVELLIFQ